MKIKIFKKVIGLYLKIGSFLLLILKIAIRWQQDYACSHFGDKLATKKRS